MHPTQYTHETSEVLDLAHSELPSPPQGLGSTSFTWGQGVFGLLVFGWLLLMVGFHGFVCSIFFSNMLVSEV